MSGPATFPEQPQRGDAPILGDLQLPAYPLGWQVAPSPSPVSVIRMASGRSVVQSRIPDDGEPETTDALEFRFPLQAIEEESYYGIRALAKLGRPFRLVDFAVVVEAWIAGPELTVFPMARPTADSDWPTFPAAAYPPRVFLDGVEQTIVTPGPPVAGEVVVGAQTVTTPGLTVGQVLELRYVPAYRVVVVEMPTSYEGYNAEVAQVVLAEASAGFV